VRWWAPGVGGYGDSDRPPGGYDKRTMAADIADLVRTLELSPVVLVGHDRGARVAHRFALDHPTLLTHLVLLDIAPTYDVFARTDQHSARARWHWYSPQLRDLPDALPPGREDIYLRHFYATATLNPAAIEEDAIQEYVRCFRQPGAMRAGFEDYRAGATIDLEHDGADRHHKVTAPTLVLWGAGSGRATQAPDMVGIWRARCGRGRGYRTPESGPATPRR